MVHALHQVHDILQPGGLLINLHDHPLPHVIEVNSPVAATKAGWLMDRADYAVERSAFDALAKAVEDGHFILEDEQDFESKIYVDNFTEFQEWLAEWWESAVIPYRTIWRVEALIRAARGPAKIVLIVPARMTRLRKL